MLPFLAWISDMIPGAIAATLQPWGNRQWTNLVERFLKDRKAWPCGGIGKPSHQPQAEDASRLGVTDTIPTCLCHPQWSCFLFAAEGICNSFTDFHRSTVSSGLIWWPRAQFQSQGFWVLISALSPISCLTWRSHLASLTHCPHV